MTAPLRMTAREFKRLTKGAAVKDIHKTTSELMLDYVRQVEKLLGRRLRPDEVRRVNPEALEYAKTIRKWIPAKAEKGKQP